MRRSNWRKIALSSAVLSLLILASAIAVTSSPHSGAQLGGRDFTSTAIAHSHGAASVQTSSGLPATEHSLVSAKRAAGFDKLTLPPVSFMSLPAIVTGLAPRPGIQFGSGYYSENWGGDFRCQLMQSGACVNPGGGNDITGVEGGWTVASVASTSSSTEYAATWVGIGGWGSDDLIQAGTAVEVSPSGATAYWAWWEMLPYSSVAVSLSPNPTISPGDQMFVSVIYQGTTTSGQVWQFSLEDVTTGSTWQANETCESECYQSTFSTAEWIQESPMVDGALVQMPAFSSFPIIDPEYYTADTSWTWTSDMDWAWQENTEYTSAATVVPSSLYADPDMFYMDYLVDTQRGTTSCCGTSQSSAEPTQVIQGSASLSSPDSFGSSQAQNLGLEVGLVTSNGSLVETDAADGSVGFSVNIGQATYSTNFQVHQGTPYATYYGVLMLWYVPQGETIGESGSLLLQEAGGVSYGPSVTIFGPSVTEPVANPVSGAVDAGQNASLTTTASGGSGGYSYAWAGLPAACSNANSPTIACHDLGSGDYSVSVTVADSVGAEFTSVSLSYAVNNDPAMSAISPSRPSVDAGQDVTFSVAATGGTGAYTFVWTGLPSSGCTGAGTSKVACNSLPEQTLTLGVTATDSAGLVAHGTALVYAVLSDPTLGVMQASPQSVDVGQTVVFATSVSGGSGGYSFTWAALPTGCQSTNSSSISCSPAGSGSFVPTVVVTDSNGYTTTATTSYLVSPLPVVEAPSATATTILHGNSVTFTVTASQGSGGLTYSWNGLPPGCVSANNPMIACTPSTTGTWNVSVTVTDSNGGTATSGGLSFTVQPSFLGLPALEGYLLICGVVIVAALAVILVLLSRRRREKPSPSRGTGGVDGVAPYSASPNPTSSQVSPAPSPGSGAVGGGASAGVVVAPVRFEQPGSGNEGLDPGSVAMATPLIDPPNPVCWHCNFQNPSGSRYCASCALPLEPPPAVGSVQERPPAKQRRRTARS